MSLTLTAPGDCPKCEAEGFENPGALAAHLIDAHDMAGIAALATAREVAGLVRVSAPLKPTKEAQPTMAKNTDRTGECKECGCLRHRKDCSQHFLARKRTSTQTRGEPVAAKKRKPITRRHPRPPAKAQDGNGLVSEISVLGAVAEALTPLEPGSRANVLGCICKLLAIDPSTLAA